MNSKKQHNELTFFIDRSIGKSLSGLLQSQGHKVIELDQIFPHNTPDSKWLEYAGNNGYIVLTKDKNIRYRSSEINMVIEHKVALFVFTKGTFNTEKMKTILNEALGKIINFTKKNNPPYIVSISKSSNLNLMYPKNDE